METADMTGEEGGGGSDEEDLPRVCVCMCVLVEL